jgi:hypothetical protein
VPIVLLATPTGGGTLEYQFLWNLSATTSLAPSWTKLPYGAGRGYTHTPTQPGYYTFRVYAREKGSTASFDRSSTDLKVKVNVPIADFAVKVTPLGSGIFAIAPDAVIGAGGAPQWKFWAKRNGVGSFTLLRDYAAGASFDTWQPTAGTYTVMVYMKEAGSKAASYDLSHSTTVVVP